MGTASYAESRAQRAARIAANSAVARESMIATFSKFSAAAESFNELEERLDQAQRDFAAREAQQAEARRSS